MEFINASNSSAIFSDRRVEVPGHSSACALVVHKEESSKLEISVGRNSSLSLYSIYFGGARAELSFLLSEKAAVEITDLFFGSVSVAVSLRLDEKNSAASLNARGVVRKDENASYSALVAIGRHAAGARVNVEEHALLAEEGARASLVPLLDIENNDVEARHASTTRQVDEEEIFYLMSRGFTERDSKREIVEGFVGNAKSKIKEIFGYRDEL